MAKEVDDFIATIANEHKSKFVEGQRDDYPKAFLTERTIRLKKNPNDTVFNGNI